MKTNIKTLITLAIFSISTFQVDAQCSKAISQHCFNGNAKDNSGNGNNGTVTGANSTTGRYGKTNTAYEFSSSSDLITLPVSSYLNKNEYTYAAWVNPSQNPVSGQAQVIISVGNSGLDQMMGLFNNPGAGHVGWCLATYSSSGKTSSFCVGKLPTVNKWYHVAFTRTNQNGKLFLNGNLVGLVLLNNVNAGYGTNSVAHVGARYNKSQNWKGKIDNVSIFSCAMSDAEVKKLYNSKFCDQDTCKYTIYDTVRVTVYDTIKVYDTVKVYDTIRVGLSENNVDGAQKLVVFPNPSQGFSNVSLSQEYIKVSYRLESIQGQLIQEEKLGFTSDFQIKLPDEPGTYILSVYSEGKLIDRIKLLRE